MREVVVEARQSYFDTNTDDHHHFFFHEHSGQLEDIPSDQINISELPNAPAGTSVSRVDVIHVRVWLVRLIFILELFQIIDPPEDVPDLCYYCLTSKRLP